MVKTEPGTNSHLLRCMADSGANMSFILSEVTRALGLKAVNKESLSIHTFGNENSKTRSYDIVEVTLRNAKDNNRKIKIRAVVIDCITLAHIKIPSQWAKNAALTKGIELADISSYPNDKIHVLIGSDYIAEILGERNIRISRRLIAVDSIFGFLLQGKDEESNRQISMVNHLFAKNEELDIDRIEKLWSMEAIGINMEKEASLSDKDVLESFERNTTYTNKRYETRLLWKGNCTQLSSNFEIAKRRLFSLGNTLRKNKELCSRYNEIIEEHIRDGIVERVEKNLDQSTSTGYFLPHHAVVREQKDTSKVRIVFDASSKRKGELSLNDCLESGPDLNPDLLSIILRFRLHKIAFCADIQRAFLEIGLAEEDREFLKFLWVKKNGPVLDLSPSNIEVLKYARVTFGVKCSSFLLAGILRLHLRKYEEEYPRACEMLRNLYVDDLINGSSDPEDALKLSKDMIFILSQASMNLRRWVSNSSILNEAWKNDHIDFRNTSEERGVPLKILGLIWDNIEDNLKLDIHQFEKFKDTKRITKRVILAACGMLFDPIGMLNPFTVRIKLLLQAIWESGISWDESVPFEIKCTFMEWLSEIDEIENIKIPRLYFTDFEWGASEVHIFSDASPKCYGCVAYFRMKHGNGYLTKFMIAKSRVAPLKGLTLPRSELMGALISSRLGSYLQDTFHKLEKQKIFYWTDSQICLHWIKGNADEWKQFVRTV
ncbi:uncharacterized protein LOC129218740 [Uloborus diversus]|uniref:uncharacterized protein LOC129218740 n=1 Tax=Uloborus diversus TaxID=327109 RepID=UPI00240A1C41|nr:uncharacterized protein LOC129218740 [Uloborus diversus]